LIEAYLLFSEQLLPLSLAGFALATIGVALVRRRPDSAAQDSESKNLATDDATALGS
jgi:drug/metabolite transporter (DMT)-like permease